MTDHKPDGERLHHIKEQVNFNLKGFGVRLTRLNDGNYYKLAGCSLAIQEDTLFLLHLFHPRRGSQNGRRWEVAKVDLPACWSMREDFIHQAALHSSKWARLSLASNRKNTLTTWGSKCVPA